MVGKTNDRKYKNPKIKVETANIMKFSEFELKKFDENPKKERSFPVNFSLILVSISMFNPNCLKIETLII